MNKRFDFTFKKFNEILDCLLHYGYSFQSFEDFLHNPAEKVVILRHDVDRSLSHSLQTAKFESARGIRGSYYFRIVKQSNHPRIIKEIASLGHEIGYHYEDVSTVAERQKTKVKSRSKAKIPPWWKQKSGSILKGDLQESKTTRQQNNGRLEKELADIAIESFAINLQRLREIASINTICMHGSPMSRWDSRILWKYYDYRDFGIIGEPYFDLDFDKVLYLTDTGRKWNGDNSSVRDKVLQENYSALKGGLKNSDNILAAARAKELPEQLMITIHPQRWSDDLLVWTREYCMQTVKNVIKKLIFVK